MKIYKSIESLIGNTPLLELSGIEARENLPAKIYGKLEYLNPAGSAKDRVAKKIIEQAEENGSLKKGGCIIEATSGNTGIGLAAVATSKGYKAIIVMPDTMSQERIKTIKAYGADIVLTPGAEGMAGAVKKAEELHKKNPGSIIAGQFENPANPQAHFETTGPEIWNDTDGKIDYLVSGIGTGGTITGTGKYLKSKNPNIKVIGVEPASSPLLTEGHSGPHGIQGIGANFVPEILDRSVVDEILTVTDEDAYETARLLGTSEGLLCGISSGAALKAAMELAVKEENKGKNIIVILPDTGDRYLSTGLFVV